MHHGMRLLSDNVKQISQGELSVVFKHVRGMITIVPFFGVHRECHLS